MVKAEKRLTSNARISNFDKLMSQLGKFKTGKSCLYIDALDDIDLQKLKALIDGSVKQMKRKYLVK